jgi:molecular chaperone DnaK
MIVGIDLGTTNSLIGAMDSGLPILFPDSCGRRLTPSVVYFPDGEEPLVGHDALRYGEQAIFSVKRLMGRRAGGCGMDRGIVGSPAEPARLRLNGGSVSPEEVSALILKKLKADAERATGYAIDRAVITVPAYFNDARAIPGDQTLAGELTRVSLSERLLAEPTASCVGLWTRSSCG